MLYKILAGYKPSRRRAHIIGKELTELTKSFGYMPLVDNHIKQNKGAAWYDEDLHAEVRMTAVPGSEGTSWHQDGDTSPGANMNCALILWSNTHPTQFKSRDNDKIFQPEPYQLVIVYNLSCLHRRPPDAPIKRFSFRQRVVWE